MSENQLQASFEQPEDLEFQNWQWRFERLIWFGMLVLILAALAGLFGSGPLSARTLENKTLHLDYDFFLRYNTPSELRVQLRADRQHKASLSLNKSFLQDIDLESVAPEPRQVQVRGSETDFEFVAFDDLEVRFQFRPMRAGALSGVLGSESPAGSLGFSQFVYP